MENGYGALALLPPLVAIVLCFVTKRVLISLFAGIFAGGLVVAGGNPLGGIANSLDAIIASITDELNARILVFDLLMGSGVALVWRLGGSRALTDWARTKIRTRRQAGVGAWVLGMVVFFNDYVNAAIVGNAFRDIYDDLKISKEKLSYVLDSTAAPVATFFISDWIAFQIGMIRSGIEAAGIEDVGVFAGYLRGIPLNLYCIFAVIFVGIIVITRWDFGPMLIAERRVEATGETYRKGASPLMDVSHDLGEASDERPMLLTFFAPIVALVAVTLLGFWWTGQGPDKSIMDILGDSDPARALLWGSFAMTVTGVAIGLGYRLMDLGEAMNTVVDGMKLMLMACLILVLAWSLGLITNDMQLAEYMTDAVGDSLSFTWLPLVIFLLGCFMSFATGTSWGTMTILTPIAIPLAYHVTGDSTTAVMMGGVVFSGAIFGDHCSPISDTTVLASIFASADHMDHVATQVPYAVLCAVVASVMYVVFASVGITPFVLIPIGIVFLIVAAYLLSRAHGRRLDGVSRAA
jgi:Na+/H+ antiporter NhaC